jgi:endoglucanase
MGGKTGTNADDIAVTAGGILTGLISIPERSMHTPVEVVDCDDVERTAQLLAAYIRSGGIH